MENKEEKYQSVSEYIANMDYLFEKDFHSIAEEEMDSYENDEFYYVVDETDDKILAHKTKNIDTPAVYLFQKREDAETWRGIGTTAALYQDHNLSVENETYSSLKGRDEAEVFGEFKLIMLTSEHAQDLFQNYPQALQTLEYRKTQEADLE